MIYTPNLETSNILANAFDVKTSYGRGIGSFGKSNCRLCTHCKKHGHIIDFCYQKHVHPQIHKSSSFANAQTNSLSNG